MKKVFITLGPAVKLKKVEFDQSDLHLLCFIKTSQ